MTTLRFLAAGLAGLVFAASASAGGGAEHPHAPEGGWAFAGATGKFDQKSVQRGYQVYKEVCSSCHSMKLLSYRNLGDKGGPFYDPEYKNPNDNPFVKALAADNLVAFQNEDGDEDSRPGIPADGFRKAYANDAKARAANAGALPPDLSVIVKARAGGADYIYSLLAGYPAEGAFKKQELAPTQAEITAHAEAVKVAQEEWNKKAAEALAANLPAPEPFVAPEMPKTFATYIDVAKLGGHGEKAGGHSEGLLLQPQGQYYNPYFAGDTGPQWDGDPRHKPAGGFLAMGPQLPPDRVQYADGTVASTEQMAKDVAQFLAWASEPKQTARKSLGLPVMIYLGVLSILLWFSYKRIWRKVEH